MSYLIENKEILISLLVALYGVAKIVVNLTPSEKDNNILAKIASVIEKGIDLFIPNLSKDGGVINTNIFIKKKE